MTSLQLQFSCLHSLSSKKPPQRCRRKLTGGSWHSLCRFPKIKFLASLDRRFRGRDGALSVRCFCSDNFDTETKNPEVEEEEGERPPFDINLAVILAGFAFEAYTTPPDAAGKREVDAAGCKTVYLSESFLREIYDGQLIINLKKGFDFPALDPWGTSDPYVVMQLDGQVAKSKTKWGTREPTWNEEFYLNIKKHPSKWLQIAAWDANLVTPHKRMGNGGVSLDPLCDGNSHEMLVKLEGMGGGGKLELEVKYKSFVEIDEEKKWWRVPFFAELLRRNDFDTALKKLLGSEAVPARQFVEYAFGQLKSFNDVSLWRNRLLSNKIDTESVEISDNGVPVSDTRSEIDGGNSEANLGEGVNMNQDSPEKLPLNDAGQKKGLSSESLARFDKRMESDKDYWKNFADVMNQNVLLKLGLPFSEDFKWDGFDLLNRIGLQSKRTAEAGYVESGLATPGWDGDEDKTGGQFGGSTVQSSLPAIKKATQDLLRQTDSVLGALVVLTAAIPQLNKEKQDSSSRIGNEASGSFIGKKLPRLMDRLTVNEKEAEEMRALFSTAESAMEAWAMLATSLGHPSFIKSEFEKICFLDNEDTDTQVAIWRDSGRRRLIIAFRGTEQSKWKDLRTDLMLVPSGLNPERIGGDFKEEVQVHSGFLSAYDSVRTRIISLLKLCIGYLDDVAEPPYKWHVYVTGHSLGGALATLLALELASSRLARHGLIVVTMYNFGSPRVGNKQFADVYNKKVKDSWRVVNHRDIIPTVPRLMGYCHVAQPVYLGGGEFRDALVNVELERDGYHGDVIGESTPDVLVGEFMKGEKELVEKILQTEVNIFRAIRDGSALMQHMEDFYYITLLENVRLNYHKSAESQQGEKAAAESTSDA